jgi:hypothetical protein
MPSHNCLSCHQSFNLFIGTSGGKQAKADILKPTDLGVRFVCELLHDLRLNVLHVLQKITPPLRHLSEARARTARLK